MITELRCESKLHGRMNGDLLEVKCSSKFCGAGPGIVVLHYFDSDGNLIRSSRFKDPARKKVRQA